MQLVIIERGDGKHQHNTDQGEHTLTENEVIAVSVVVIRVGIACGEHHDKSHGKQHKAHGHVEQARRDGQTATSENVYENLAENAWFPALYADEVLMDDFGPDFPEV